MHRDERLSFLLTSLKVPFTPSLTHSSLFVCLFSLKSLPFCHGEKRESCDMGFYKQLLINIDSPQEDLTWAINSSVSWMQWSTPEISQRESLTHVPDGPLPGTVSR